MNERIKERKSAVFRELLLDYRLSGGEAEAGLWVVEM